MQGVVARPAVISLQKGKWVSRQIAVSTSDLDHWRPYKILSWPLGDPDFTIGCSWKRILRKEKFYTWLPLLYLVFTALVLHKSFNSHRQAAILFRQHQVAVWTGLMLLHRVMCNTAALVRRDWVWYIVKHLIKTMKTTSQPVFNCHKTPSLRAAIMHNYSIRQFYHTAFGRWTG